MTEQHSKPLLPGIRSERNRARQMTINFLREYSVQLAALNPNKYVSAVGTRIVGIGDAYDEVKQIAVAKGYDPYDVIIKFCRSKK